MAYYIKQGQSSIFQEIKIIEDECQIQKTISKISTKKLEKIVKKIKKKNINPVVLSKEIKQNQEFIEMLNNYDITIFDGKWLMQYMLQDIIVYLKEKQKIKTDDEITILANDLNNEVKQNIKTFANIYKKIRIVTNHLEKFKKLEQELYEENGTPIIITNNKRKALAKSELIINFDFVQECINQYNINENAIIINLGEKIKINKKRFNGIVITDYEVEIEKNDEEDETEVLESIIKKQTEFALKEILEERIYTESKKQLNFNIFQTVQNAIKKYKINIKELNGINGVIN